MSVFGKLVKFVTANVSFGTFGKIWAFAGFVIFVNVLGILVSSSLYFWLKIQDNSMLKNAKVSILAMFDRIGYSS